MEEATSQKGRIYGIPFAKSIHIHLFPLHVLIQVFPNDFPALLDPSASAPFLANDRPVARDPTSPSSDLFSISPTFGTAKVITYSPRHDLTLALMGVPEIREVVRTWTEVYVQEGKAIREGHREAGGQSGAKDEGCVNIFEVCVTVFSSVCRHSFGSGR